jgi:hypothetical protein
MKYFFKERGLRRVGDERSSGDHINQERIFSVYMDRKGGDSLTTKFAELVIKESVN